MCLTVNMTSFSIDINFFGHTFFSCFAALHFYADPLVDEIRLNFQRFLRPTHMPLFQKLIFDFCV